MQFKMTESFRVPNASWASGKLRTSWPAETDPLACFFLWAARSPPEVWVPRAEENPTSGPSTLAKQLSRHWSFGHFWAGRNLWLGRNKPLPRLQNQQLIHSDSLHMSTQPGKKGRKMPQTSMIMLGLLAHWSKVHSVNTTRAICPFACLVTGTLLGGLGHELFNCKEHSATWRCQS